MDGLVTNSAEAGKPGQLSGASQAALKDGSEDTAYGEDAQRII